MTSPSNQPDDRPQGQTLPVQGEKQERSPRAPHERDESADSQAASEPSARAIGKKAHDDLAEGRVDTDKGPVLDAAYDKVREGASQPVKQFRP
jgi:hypothetical protein